MTSTRDPAPARTLTARCHEDLLAVAPVVLGFWPQDDIVMMTFGCRRPFHARTDLLPRRRQSRAALRELEEALLGPARRHGAEQVVLLYYSADASAVRGVHEVLQRGCRRAGIDVVTALHVDGGRHRALGAGPASSGFVDHDVSCHPFVVDAVVSGRLAHASRADLVASLRPDPDAVSRCAAELVRGGWSEGHADARWLRSEGRWAIGLVGSCAARGEPPAVADLARLVAGMRAVRVRDAAWSLVGQDTAASHVAFWTRVVPQVPDAFVPGPAALLGWSAWQAGDGALAWAAVDRCRAADPRYPLAATLAAILQQAVPPDFWQSGFDWALGLSAEDV